MKRKSSRKQGGSNPRKSVARTKKEPEILCRGKPLFSCSIKGGSSSFVCEQCRERRLPLERTRLTKLCKCSVLEKGKDLWCLSVSFFESVVRTPNESYNMVAFASADDAKTGDGFSEKDLIQTRRFIQQLDHDENVWDGDGIELRVDKCVHKLLPIKILLKRDVRSSISSSSSSSSSDLGRSRREILFVDSVQSPGTNNPEIERLRQIVLAQSSKIERNVQKLAQIDHETNDLNGRKKWLDQKLNGEITNRDCIEYANYRMKLRTQRSASTSPPSTPKHVPPQLSALCQLSKSLRNERKRKIEPSGDGQNSNTMPSVSRKTSSSSDVSSGIPVVNGVVNGVVKFQNMNIIPTGTKMAFQMKGQPLGVAQPLTYQSFAVSQFPFIPLTFQTNGRTVRSSRPLPRAKDISSRSSSFVATQPINPDVKDVMENLVTSIEKKIEAVQDEGTRRTRPQTRARTKAQAQKRASLQKAKQLERARQLHQVTVNRPTILGNITNCTSPVTAQAVPAWPIFTSPVVPLIPMPRPSQELPPTTFFQPFAAALEEFNTLKAPSSSSTNGNSPNIMRSVSSSSIGGHKVFNGVLLDTKVGKPNVGTSHLGLMTDVMIKQERKAAENVSTGTMDRLIGMQTPVQTATI